MFTWGQTYGRIENTFPIAYNLSPQVVATVQDAGNVTICAISVDWTTPTQFYVVSTYSNNYYDDKLICYISIGY